MSAVTFHKDIRLPNGFVAPTHNVPLRYLAHAVTACTTDRYGSIDLFDFIDLSEWEVIEVTVEDGYAVKYLIRGAYDETHDVSLVVIPTPGRWMVKTCWLNHMADAHRTLDRSKYA